MSKSARGRKKPTRSVKPRFYVLCEGKKTEPNYFRDYIEDHGYGRGKRVEVKVVDTTKNTPRELVKEGKQYKREFSGDEIWVAFDRDGYTKHPETFDLAERSGIKIAFSSVCFEIWILAHYEYTTTAFANYEELKKKKLDKRFPNYEKGGPGIYDVTKALIETAKKHARRFNRYCEESHPAGTKPYAFNPYTNVHELLEAMDAFWKTH